MKILAWSFPALFFLLTFAIGLAEPKEVNTTSADPAESLTSLRNTLREIFQPRLREAISQPSNPGNAQVVEDTKDIIAKLRELPQPPALNVVANADRYRMIAFLEVMLARLQSERFAYQSGPPGVDPSTEVGAFARAALSDIATSNQQVEEARRPDSNTSPEWLQWMNREDIPGHLLHLEAHAHAMVWKVTSEESQRAAARSTWQAASLTPFGKKNTQPSPELANALALYRLGEDPRLMTTLIWIGVGMMAVAVIIALFVPHPSSFQMFVFRILAALGAAGIGAVLPGFIGFKTPSITAGGAVALFVLIYLVNPPKLARNLAGN